MQDSAGLAVSPLFGWGRGTKVLQPLSVSGNISLEVISQAMQDEKVAFNPRRNRVRKGFTAFQNCSTDLMAGCQHKPRLEALTEAQRHLLNSLGASLFQLTDCTISSTLLVIFLNRFSLQALEHDFQKQLAVAA